jgi:hypothetical protein
MKQFILGGSIPVHCFSLTLVITNLILFLFFDLLFLFANGTLALI